MSLKIINFITKSTKLLFFKVANLANNYAIQSSTFLTLPVVCNFKTTEDNSVKILGQLKKWKRYLMETNKKYFP